MKPMINPYKGRPLARLCTLALRTLGSGSPREVGQGKGGDLNRESQAEFWKENSWMDSAPVLRRRTEEKLTRAPAVAVHPVHQEGMPAHLWL
jgi:hypothetical protein